MRNTAFGVTFTDPVTTARVLRAAASARGVELATPDLEKSAAAVVLAHVWCTVHVRTSIVDVAGLSEDDVAIAARVLLLAAGYRAESGLWPEPTRRVPDEGLTAAEDALMWVQEQPVDPDDVHRLVVDALSGLAGTPVATCLTAAYSAIHQP